MSLTKVNPAEKMRLISQPWDPKIVGEVNDTHVKLAKFSGEFDWHSHENEDEMFYVISGQMKLSFRDGDVIVDTGEFIIVPKGVEHKPASVGDECHIMMIEPATTLNTGENAASDRTKINLDRI